MSAAKENKKAQRAKQMMEQVRLALWFSVEHSQINAAKAAKQQAATQHSADPEPVRDCLSNPEHCGRMTETLEDSGGFQSLNSNCLNPFCLNSNCRSHIGRLVHHTLFGAKVILRVSCSTSCRNLLGAQNYSSQVVQIQIVSLPSTDWEMV